MKPVDRRLTFAVAAAAVLTATTGVLPVQGQVGPERLRSQSPVPPFPYEEEEISTRASDGVHLAGTLTRPRSGERAPAVVLLSVAGPNDRDMSFAGHRLFAVIADALTRRGLVVARFDDRGVGHSTGNLFSASYETLTADAQAMVTMLKARPDVDPQRVGLLGISEGAAIAASLAAASRDVAYLVLLSPPAMPGESALRGSLERSLAMMALPPQRADTLRSAFARFVSLARAAGADTSAARQLLEFLEGDGRALVPPYSFVPRNPVEQARIFSGPWYLAQLNYEPAPYFERLTVPVLALLGERDQVFPVDENSAALTRLLQRAPTRDVTTETMPGLNHLMQSSMTGLPSEYPRIEETVSPLVLARVGDWLARIVSAKLPPDNTRPAAPTPAAGDSASQRKITNRPPSLHTAHR